MEQAAQQPVTPLRFVRHIVGMAILALASPYVWYGSERALTWFSTWITPLVIAAVVYGLYSLAFQKRAKEAWPQSFFMLAWVILALGVVSPYFEAFNNKQGAPNDTTRAAAPAPGQQEQAIDWEKGVFTPPNKPPSDRDGKPCTEITEFLGECKRQP